MYENVEFGKGDYIVITKEVKSWNGELDHCYKLINDNYFFDDCSRIPFEEGVRARYATASEICTYNKIGKPFNVYNTNEKSVTEISKLPELLNYINQ